MGEWRRVPGFPYEVSSCGQVRRAAPGSNATKPGRLLKPHTDRDGYAIVILSVGGVTHTRKVHRLVCEVFYGPADGREVRHLDGNPANNAVGNLRWGTAAENADDRDRHERTPRGERHSRALLTDGEAKQLRADYALAKLGRQRVPRGWITAMAGHYGMSRDGIATVVAGRGYPVATIGCDFDATLCDYEAGWTGTAPTGEPLPGALEFVRGLVASGYQVVIFSARASTPAGADSIARWLVEHGFPALPVTHKKLHSIDVFIDDRAVPFRGDFDRTRADVDELLAHPKWWVPRARTEVERCEGCGRQMVDDPGVPGGLICPACDADLLGEVTDASPA